MTRKSRRRRTFTENPIIRADVLRMGEASVAEHGLRAAYRAAVRLGCAGFTRYSDRVSTDHFLL